MPTTLVGLAIFVTFLTPGFVYLVRTETRLPERRYSLLRETVTIVSVSLAVNGVILGLFAILRYLLPTITPDAGAIVRESSTYFQSNYAEVTLWSAVLLLAATCLAAVIAVPPAWSSKCASKIRFWPGPTIATFIATRQLQGPIEQLSGWGFAFTKRPHHRVYVGLDLKDGTYLYGPLFAFSTDLEENDARSIQIGRPVKIRPPGDNITAAEDWDVDRVIVSASQLKTISVRYVPSKPEDGDSRDNTLPAPAVCECDQCQLNRHVPREQREGLFPLGRIPGHDQSGNDGCECDACLDLIHADKCRCPACDWYYTERGWERD